MIQHLVFPLIGETYVPEFDGNRLPCGRKICRWIRFRFVRCFQISAHSVQGRHRIAGQNEIPRCHSAASRFPQKVQISRSIPQEQGYRFHKSAIPVMILYILTQTVMCISIVMIVLLNPSRHFIQAKIFPQMHVLCLFRHIGQAPLNAAALRQSAHFIFLGPAQSQKVQHGQPDQKHQKPKIDRRNDASIQAKADQCAADFHRSFTHQRGGRPGPPIHAHQPGLFVLILPLRTLHMFIVTVQRFAEQQVAVITSQAVLTHGFPPGCHGPKHLRKRHSRSQPAHQEQRFVYLRMAHYQIHSHFGQIHGNVRRRYHTCRLNHHQQHQPPVARPDTP